jgi:hypothetical protein
MDLYRIIDELVEERNRLQRIIESLEAVDSVAAAPPQPRQTGRGRRSMDHAARKEVSERMKVYWAKRRAGADSETTA